MPNYPHKPLYNIWSSMRQRCENPNAHKYRDYGGRGISVCERWSSYEAFAEDMGTRPSMDHSLDRIDNDGNYTPENCKWSTRSEQQLNRRNPCLVEVDGIVYRAYTLAKIAGVKVDTIKVRASKGWTYDEVISRTRIVKVPTWENAIKAHKASAALRTHCKMGHELTPENTCVSKDGWKTCRTCHNKRKREYARGRYQS